ncbi:MAG: ANTAR domain-containing protein [Clostridiales bacterium]|nr:ANTAR domain-containing protein [Clostridiales bacterium]
MIKVILAFSSKDASVKIAKALEASGIHVFRACGRKSELLSLLADEGGPVVVAGFKVWGQTITQLYQDFPKGVAVAAIVTPEQKCLMEDCPDIFTLTTPVLHGELARAVEALARPGRCLIRDAKKILMERFYMSESQAHRYIQKRSMDAGRKIEEVAKSIIEGEGAR